MRKPMMILMTAVVITLAAQAAWAAAQQTTGGVQVAQNSVRMENGAGGSDILNPFPGETITDRQPMIGVKLPAPDPPIKPETIKIFIDGDDVTSETQIGLEYIFYTPQIPLKFGRHNIIVSFSDMADKPLTPISWSFAVAAQAARQPAQPVRGQKTIPLSEQKPSITGRYLFKIKTINLNSANRDVAGGCSSCAETDIKYPEAINTSGTFDFTDKFYGKSLTGHYDRSIEEIYGRAAESFYFRYLDNNDDITLGDFTLTAVEFSPLTINGVQMRGLKTKRVFGIHTFTTFEGRSQEPQDGRLKRKTYGLRVDSNFSSKHLLKFTALRSREYGNPNVSLLTFTPPTAYQFYTSSYPARDRIYSLRHIFTHSKKLQLDSEAVQDYHSISLYSVYNASKPLTAVRFHLSYKPEPFEFSLTHRSIDPGFNPTLLGTFTEKDRRGAAANIKYASRSGKLALTSMYDMYHDNLHHVKTNDMTDDTTNSLSSITLNYGWILPQLTLRYGKLYTNSDYPSLAIGTKFIESTNASLNVIKDFHNTNLFTGTRLVATFSRYDIDRLTNSSGAASDYNLRSDTQNWTFSSRYKDLLTVSYNTSWNKSWSYSKAGAAAASINDSKSNTDAISAQINVVPFKFIVNYRYRRSVSLTSSLTDIVTPQPSGSLLEYQHTLTMLYYIDQKHKLSLELIDYDKDYRAQINKGRSYDETSVELGYSVEF